MNLSRYEDLHQNEVESILLNTFRVMLLTKPTNTRMDAGKNTTSLMEVIKDRPLTNSSGVELLAEDLSGVITPATYSTVKGLNRC